MRVCVCVCVRACVCVCVCVLPLRIYWHASLYIYTGRDQEREYEKGWVGEKRVENELLQSVWLFFSSFALPYFMASKVLFDVNMKCMFSGESYWMMMMMMMIEIKIIITFLYVSHINAYEHTPTHTHTHTRANKHTRTHLCGRRRGVMGIIVGLGHGYRS